MNELIQAPPGRIKVDMIKGILFDVDGTLSDTDDHMVMRFTRILKPISWLFKQHNPKKFARWIVMAMETPGNFIYGLADKLGLDNLFVKFYNHYSKKVRERNHRKRDFSIIPGTKEMLEHLAEKYPLGIVSARDELTTMQFLRHFDLVNYFNVVVTAQTCEHTKPYPDPILCGANGLSLQPENCVMVGDTIIDIQAGKSAGVQTIAVLCGFGTRKELERVGADLILAKTPDIVTLFDQ